VDYGPLSFSLAIKEKFESYGSRNPNWPEWEVFPQSPWNYGLVLDEKNPVSSFKLTLPDAPLAAQPFYAGDGANQDRGNRPSHT